MKINFKNITILSLLAMVLVMMSCGGEKKRKDGRTDTTTQGEISFYCDESFSPIIDELIDVYQMQCPNTKLKPIYTNEIDGINMLLQQKTWLTITARNFTPKEYTYIKDGLDMLPEAVPLAYDGMALICNNQNLDSCISVKDVKDILLGKKTKWSEVNPGSKLGEIWVCFDNRKSSAVNYCCDSILGGKPIDSPNVFAAKDSKDVIDYVSKTPNAIGVIGSNWLNDKRDTTNITFKKNITVMSICQMEKATEMNSWKPYQLYLLDGRYPFARTVYALLADPYHGLPVGVANFMQSPQGQKIILKSALLPYRGDLEWRRVQVNDD